MSVSLVECCYSQRVCLQVYQSLDHELQRHVSLQDTLQQCQTWLNSVSEEPEPPAHPPLSLEEALQQVEKKPSSCLIFFFNVQQTLTLLWTFCKVKRERTLQEQASTYLQLVCSTCDLSDSRVRETAADIQHVKLQVSHFLNVCTGSLNNLYVI